MTTKIVKCTCKHEDQDKLYGVGNRAANEMRSGQLRCTVCSAVLGSQNVTQAKPAKESVKEPAKEQSKKKEQATSKSAAKTAEKTEKKKSLKGGKR
jgi:hypothetical protein